MDIDKQLDDLLGRQEKIEHQMSGISRTLGGLKAASTEANTVNGIIETTSSLADKVGTKVRRLDEARVSCNFILSFSLPSHSFFQYHGIKINFSLIFFAHLKRNVYQNVSNVCTI